MKPDALRERLFESVATADGELLATLCRDHRDAIERHFIDWKVVPASLRDDRSAVERYVASLLAIARFFAEVLGDPRLMHQLTGGAEPLMRWQTRLQEAQSLMQSSRYDEAAALCEELLEHTRDWQGSGVDAYRPVTLGLLGAARFDGGQPERALAPYREAFEACEASADREGMLAHATNLAEVHRWLGQTDLAADMLERAASVVADDTPDEAERYRQWARRVREGEPPVRVVVVLASGRKLELDEIDGVPELAEGRIQFAYERNRVTLGAAASPTEQGMAAAERGALQEAIHLFEQATRIDPHDPAPRHHAALAAAELGRFDEAAQRYAAVEQRAPGWYRTREDAWLVSRIRDGVYEPTVLTAVRELEDGARPPRARVALAEETLERHPDLARIWLALGRAHAELGERGQAERALTRAVELAPEPAVQTRALTELGGMSADREEGRRHLHRAIELGGDLVAAAMARVILVLAHATDH